MALRDGRATVTTAGTAVQLAAQGGLGRLGAIAITALSLNTGTIVVGGSTVVAAAGTRRGIPLAAGASVTISTGNLSDVWLDATVSGEGVSFAYTTV